MEVNRPVPAAKSVQPASKLRMRLNHKLAEVRRNRTLYAMIAPYFLIFFTFTVLPVVLSLIISFTSFNMLELPKWVGWKNYARLFVQDDVFLIALKNTLMFAVITGPISYIACFVLAWIINELSPKVRTFATLVFYAPALSGNAFIVWTLLFSGDAYGYINAFLMKWRVILEPILWLKDTKYIMPIIIIVQLWLSLGTSFLAFIAGLQGMDKSLYEAGAIDGVKNRWQELWYITLPSMRPQLLFGAVIQITSSFAVAEVATTLAGFPSVQYAGHTIVTHLMDFGSLRYEMGYASSIATVLFGIMLGSNLIVQKLLRKVGD
ncbi:binding-protein-dependent transport systems inner membrane component [Paenibacillus alvei TS-15]|uniref:Binding-protein-dependent transport systems inner membrane component n=2 Tax=Paenibacillus alvei TaxID=44250 RepID=S9U2F8_PAEAL|nr:binding-protein-dependent transport systems inner membrane component [Paenibacillus alvei TS-15]